MVLTLILQDSAAMFLTPADYPIAYLWTALVLIWILVLRSRRPNYPPGPKGLPLIGNLLDVPTDYAWRTYNDIAEKYSASSFNISTSGQGSDDASRVGHHSL